MGTEQLTGVRLRVRDTTVADYVVEPRLDPTLSPRPYLHPVRTLGGIPVTDTVPADHRWHLGVSVTMQDVAGSNLWGGRTYVRDAGYTWLDDHGRVVHDAWLARTEEGFTERLRWLDQHGGTLLTEEREVTARQVTGRDDAWLLDFGYTLTAPDDREIVLGSPATNGRPGGAGYGGFFWRLAPGEPATFTASVQGEEQVNGSTEEWVAVVGQDPAGSAYTLVFTGLGDGDHWFVRAAGYPGVCVALAFEQTRTVAPSEPLRRRHRVLVVDGVLDRDGVGRLLA